MKREIYIYIFLFVALGVFGMLFFTNSPGSIFTGNVLTGNVILSNNDNLIYDGDTAGALVPSASCLDKIQEGNFGFSGNGLMLTPNQYYKPLFNEYCNLGSNSINLSKYSRIEFYIKTPNSSTSSYAMQIGPYNQLGKSINIASYVSGGVIDGNWKKVSIPSSAFYNPTWTAAQTDYFANTIQFLYWDTDASSRNYYVDNLVFIYNQSSSSTSCTESWTCSNWGTCSNGQQTRTCTDANSCGTTANRPLLTQSCSMTPTCIESWTCNSWSTCNNGQQTRTCTDANSCGTIISQPATNQVCGTSQGNMVLNIASITSSKISLTWNLVSGATGYNVYIASEPQLLSDVNSRVKVSTLSGTSYTITGLTAATNVFVRVEAIGVVSTYGDIAVKTIGGTRSNIIDQTGAYALDGPMREVHMAAPDVLEIVLTDLHIYSDGITVTGNDGSDWQAGTWTVRKSDGTAIPISAVYRNSIPVGSDYFTVGYGGADADYSDADHHIFLKFGQNVGNNAILNITHVGTAATTLNVLLPFSDKYLETQSIQLNQLGYNPSATKRYAYVSAWLGDGNGLNLISFPISAEIIIEPSSLFGARNAIRTLPITLRLPNPDPDAGTEVRQIDLASLSSSEANKYRIRIPGVGISWQTEVSNASVFKAYYTTLRALYHLRWCGNLDPQYTNFWRPSSGNYGRADHCEAYVQNDPSFTGKGKLPYDGGEFFCPNTLIPSCTLVGGTTINCGSKGTCAMTPTNLGVIPVRGGHHDAGDFDFSSYHYQLPMYLMYAYETHPEVFVDNQTNIPESGNGIPDILDEALWNIKGWEDLQNTITGAVRTGVESWRHPLGYYFPNMEYLNGVSGQTLQFWTYSPTSVHGLKVAGIFAQASRLVQPYDSARANDLRSRAIKAYDYAIANGATLANSRGPMIYAVGQLYALTGNATYKTQYETAWTTYDQWGMGFFPASNVYEWGGATDEILYPMHGLGYFQAIGASSVYLAAAKTWLSARATDEINRIDNHAFRVFRETLSPVLNYDTASGRSLQNIYARMELGGMTVAEKQTYINTLSLTADYTLGGNPLGISYVTGLGERYPQDALWDDSLAGMVQYGRVPIPGIALYGFTDSLPNDYHKKAGNLFYPAFDTRPPLKRMGDARHFVWTAEFDLYTETMVNQLFATLLSYPTAAPVANGTFNATINLAPSVFAGADQTITLPANSVSLSGSASDDGKPFGTLTYLWSVISGSGAIISNPNSLSTAATFSQLGNFVLRLNVSDGALSSTDDLIVVVNNESIIPRTGDNCTLYNATFSTTSVLEGDAVTLIVDGAGCEGRVLNFSVWEDDFSYGVFGNYLDSLANVLPTSATIVGGRATTSWIAEWQNDCAGLCNPPEYYFVANLVINASNSIRSPIELTVNQRPVSPPLCIENWNCGNWSICTNDSQSRTCSDANSCNTTDVKPAETQICASTPPVNNTNSSGGGSGGGGGGGNISIDFDKDGINNSLDLCPNTPLNLSVNYQGCPKPLIKINYNVTPNLQFSNLFATPNFTIGNKYGSISYPNASVLLVNNYSGLTVLPLDIANNINISYKKIYLNAVNLPTLNRPAILTYYGITSTKPYIKSLRTCTECKILSYSNQVLVIYVPHFTYYEIVDESELPLVKEASFLDDSRFGNTLRYKIFSQKGRQFIFFVFLLIIAICLIFLVKSLLKKKPIEFDQE